MLFVANGCETRRKAMLVCHCKRMKTCYISDIHNFYTPRESWGEPLASVYLHDPRISVESDAKPIEKQRFPMHFIAKLNWTNCVYKNLTQTCFPCFDTPRESWVAIVARFPLGIAAQDSPGVQKQQKILLIQCLLKNAIEKCWKTLLFQWFFISLR